MVNKMVDFRYENFMLGCRFNIEAYVKNVRDKVD